MADGVRRIGIGSQIRSGSSNRQIAEAVVRIVTISMSNSIGLGDALQISDRIVCIRSSAGACLRYRSQPIQLVVHMVDGQTSRLKLGEIAVGIVSVIDRALGRDLCQRIVQRIVEIRSGAAAIRHWMCASRPRNMCT